MNIKSIFGKIFKGEQGEVDVFEAISKILNNDGGENYYLIPKATIDDAAGGSKEIDLLLLHPVLGIYVIEVKNWSSLNMLDDKNDPYEQVKIYHKMLLAKIDKILGKIPINIEYRVIFPSIERKDAGDFYKTNPNYANFKNHTFFKDDLADKEIFAKFFNSSVNILPNKKEFLKISELLVSQSKIKQNKVIPIITKDEIMFFDHKQLSIMNGYTGGFRIIRGVAGTGKTMILANFVANRIERDESEKFLILCFNKNLAESIKSSFGERFSKSNIAIYPIVSLLTRIGFDKAKVGITDTTSLDETYKIYESDEALSEFRTKFKAHLAKHPIDYVLCDETQDMPAGFMRIIYEEINDSIFFIDEAQKFYSYTMNSIADIFHHPKFQRLDMRGRVKNLKNVYRTPSNIAKCAFEILGLDAAINSYYKNSYYLNNNFLTDIDCVLQSGTIKLADVDEFNHLRSFLKTLPNDETSVVLSNSKKSVEAIKTSVVPNNKNIDVMTM
ncbi:NERD domain-containing protein [Campylobacter sp. MOP7]|uniref:NERD domain-containing protein n=1 Tax=Campylobacter canis TaxID=3378588 RepID=UPI00387E8296